MDGKTRKMQKKPMIGLTMTPLGESPRVLGRVIDKHKSLGDSKSQESAVLLTQETQFWVVGRGAFGDSFTTFEPRQPSTPLPDRRDHEYIQFP